MSEQRPVSRAPQPGRANPRNVPHQATLVRLIYWLGGALALMALVSNASNAGLERLVGVGLAWLLLGALAEWVAWWTRQRGPAATAGRNRPTPPPPGPIPIEGVESTPNCDAAPWRRITRKSTSLPGSRHTAGPAPRTEDWLVCSVFLGAAQPWTEVEQARACGAVERAIAWIEREAVAWGSPARFRQAAAYLSVDDAEPLAPSAVQVMEEEHQVGLGEADESIELLARLSRRLSAQGWQGLAEALQSIERGAGWGRILAVVQVRRAGRSHWVMEHLDGRVCICYAQDADFPGKLTAPPLVDPATIAHELLHMLGATDKYGAAAASFGPGMVTEHDIMLLHHDRLGRLRVDRLTAQELGWIGAHEEPPAAIAQRKRRDGPGRRGVSSEAPERSSGAAGD